MADPLTQAAISVLLGGLASGLLFALIIWLHPGLRSYFGLRMKPFSVYTEGDDLRDAFLWWGRVPGRYWRISVCVLGPVNYRSATVRYRHRFYQKWTWRTGSFPRRP